MQKLTVRQREIYDFIESSATVSDHLKALEKKGYVKRERGRSRGIELLKKRQEKGTGNNTTLPLLVRITENCPLLTEKNIDKKLSIQDIIQTTEGTFLIKVGDNAMKKSGFFHGDIIIAKTQSSAPPEEIVVTCMSCKPTIRRLVVEGNHVLLKPDTSFVPGCSVEPEFQSLSAHTHMREPRLQYQQP